MSSVEGKVVLVTGASSGIGRAHAVRFAEHGANVVITDIEEHVPTVAHDYSVGVTSRLDETADLVREAGGNVVTAIADVRDQAQLDAAAAKGVAEFGQIDVLIANAGIISVGNIWELTDEQWRVLLDINLTGVWRSMKAVVPDMMKRQSGSLVFISSINGMEAGPNYAHYTSAKHGVIGLMRSAAYELGPHGIRCNAILPGVIDTPQNRWQGALDMMAGHPGGTMEDRDRAGRRFGALKDTSWLPPEAIADAAMWLSSDGARFVTGAVIPVESGHLILPGYKDV